MARLKHRGDEAGLREYLLKGAVAFRELFGHLDDRCWVELSKPVDLLVGREAFSFYRYELPLDHPLRGEGSASDRFVLSEDDELVMRP